MRRWSNQVRRGFTLMELIVAVGAFALVAVSVATIFSSVGDTISAGRRQSRLNQVTAQIERVMRRDFERMTRDGFLVIRNEWAIAVDGAQPDNDGDGYTDRLNVEAFPGDPNPRPRRVDQIMFFARGDFETARMPVQPGFIARSSEARIWYGHGQRKFNDGDPFADEDPTYPGTYEKPRLDDTMQGLTLPGKAAIDRLGYNPGLGFEEFVNPNRYASDWSLLRHVTLLVPSADPLAQALPDFGADGLYGYPVDRSNDANGLRTGVTDGAYQVALQPAVSSIFWAFQQLDPALSAAGAQGTPGYVRDLDPNQNPAFASAGYPRVVDIAYDDQTIAIQPTPSGLPETSAARTSSGLIDIATTSLAEIESIVTAFDYNINQTTVVPGLEGVENFAEFDDLIRRDKMGVYFPKTFARKNKPWQMMVNALPVAPDATADSLSDAGPHSDEVLAEMYNFGSGVAQAHRNRTSPRIRFEPSPPDPRAGLDVDTSDPTDIIRTIYEQADQEVLTRWAFVPRCTEFIVEWTYGWVFDDTYGSGSQYYVTPGDPRYKQTIWFGRERCTMDTDGDGRIVAGMDRPTVLFYQHPMGVPDPGSADPERPNRGLLVGQDTLDDSTPPPAETETAAFGYVGWVPDGAIGVGGSGGGGSLVPMKWPTQIRVTMSLADPADPSIESTIEVIFDVPDDDRGAL